MGREAVLMILGLEKRWAGVQVSEIRYNVSTKVVLVCLRGSVTRGSLLATCWSFPFHLPKLFPPKNALSFFLSTPQ